MRWVERFQGGAVRLRGRVDGRELADGVSVGAGEIEVAFTFEGGEQPAFLAIALVGDVRYLELRGAELDVDCDGVQLDGVDVGPPVRMDRVIESLLMGLSDVVAWLEVFPRGELLVKFQHGVQVAISHNAVVRLEGAAVGSPGSLRLCEPLVLSVDGEGLRLSHRRFRRLAALADIRVEGAALHPDGEVTLKGGANAALDRVVRGGLKRASARLSELVRRSPRFARVRTFLKAAHHSSSGSR